MESYERTAESKALKIQREVTKCIHTTSYPWSTRFFPNLDTNVWERYRAWVYLIVVLWYPGTGLLAMF